MKLKKSRKAAWDIAFRLNRIENDMILEFK